MVNIEAVAQDLCSVGNLWKAEVQIDAFACSVNISARLAEMIVDAFNNVSYSEEFPSCRADEIFPNYADEDETIQYVVNITIFYKQ